MSRDDVCTCTLIIAAESKDNKLASSRSLLPASSCYQRRGVAVVRYILNYDAWSQVKNNLCRWTTFICLPLSKYFALVSLFIFGAVRARLWHKPAHNGTQNSIYKVIFGHCY